MNDQLLIEQAYRKIYENKSVLIPRRSAEERQKNYQIALQKQIQQYIKNGSVGYLDLSNSPITKLPEGLEVDGDLNLENAYITSLPEGLKVSGDLYLGNTRRLNSLPEALKVGGDLYLGNTIITSLPESLTVGGDLYLSNTHIARQYTNEQLKQMLPNVKGEIYK